MATPTERLHGLRGHGALALDDPAFFARLERDAEWLAGRLERLAADMRESLQTRALSVANWERRSFPQPPETGRLLWGSCTSPSRPSRPATSARWRARSGWGPRSPWLPLCRTAIEFSPFPRGRASGRLGPRPSQTAR